MKTIQKYLSKNILSVIIASAMFVFAGCAETIDTTTNPVVSGESQKTVYTVSVYNFYTVKSFNEVWNLSLDEVVFYADKLPYAYYVTLSDVEEGEYVFTCTYVGGAFIQTRTFTLPIQVKGNISIALEKNSFSGMMQATVYDF